METKNRLLKPKEVADYLGVSVDWVYDHATRAFPRLAAIKLGRGRRAPLRFRSEDVAEFLEKQWLAPNDDHKVD